MYGRLNPLLISGTLRRYMLSSVVSLFSRMGLCNGVLISFVVWLWHWRRTNGNRTNDAGGGLTRVLALVVLTGIPPEMGFDHGRTCTAGDPVALASAFLVIDLCCGGVP